ncbi:MAG: TetR/AcrR family transcriptional regulator [Desulfobacter sp.]|nr:TetR/AcrR family transcriptional regulator [Desulfobacter sp.]WDP84916.1 MAG: TetR/AcrR family transcriptional regulator [Desulfobacter sp.]
MGRKSNAPERRDQIVWALYDCLVEKGHEKVTIKEIAKKAGLPPGVIHYYFKTKDEIVSNLGNAIIEKYSTEIRILIRQAQSPDQQVKSAIEFITDRLIFNLSLNRVFYNLIQMGFEREELMTAVSHMFDNYRKQMASVFKAAGGKEESRLLSACLVAVAEGFSLQFMVDPKALSRKDVNTVIIGLIEDRLNIKIPE